MNKHLRRFLRATSGPSSSYIQSGVTIVVTMLIQTVAAIWWLAKLDLRVHMHDKFVEQNQGLIEIVYRLEERVKNLTEEVNELEAIHKHK